jgi:Bacterial antitoxin of type II TA system, VapB
MAIRVAVHGDVLAEAHRLGGHGTNRETVDEALTEYIARRKRLAALRAFGTLAFDTEYDYEYERRRRRSRSIVRKT